jgi:NACHT domain- and WD repeat-containing protein
VTRFDFDIHSDTSMERNSLMQHTYPKLKEYCREKHGLEFQVVDMRWGVRDEATDDHKTTELCMQEIDNCQRVSVGPNFVVSICQMIHTMFMRHSYDAYQTDFVIDNVCLLIL